MYHWRVFLWEKGKKSTEYTEYIVAPIFIEDRLDETLDTGEIILKCMPISSRSAFPPKTKFRLERYLKEDFTDEPKTWDMVVEHDDVEEYEGCPEICTHRVHLIEASVIAQGMHVDNIALTYELQDVTLNYKTVVGSSDTIQDVGTLQVSNNGHPTPIHSNPQMRGPGTEDSVTYTFENSYYYHWINFESLQNLTYKQDGRESRLIEFDIPELWAQGCYQTGMWQDIFEMKTQTIIYRRLYNKQNSLVSEDVILERICGPRSFGNERIDEVYTIKIPYQISDAGSNGSSTTLSAFGTEIADCNETDSGILVTVKKQFSDLYTSAISEVSVDTNTQSKKVTFTTAVLTEEQLNAGMYYEYEILCKRYPSYDTTTLPIYYSRICKVYHGNGGLRQQTLNTGRQTVNANTIFVDAKFRITDLSTSISGDKFITGARKYNCYDLIRKAMLTCDTQIFNNNEVGLDSLNYPIMIDDETAAKLRSCNMYETIFEQKNLWEILLQSGYYLHAIPYLEFAKDGTDRFVLKYKQLGGTKKKENNSNKMTVFNSSNLSDYFTQYDSYVTNLFSPQNQIEEWGFVKTSDSSYLISNSTAEIHTKYPIQEIKEFDLIYGNTTKSALEMVFEESIYSILTPNMDVRPSKACALYYKLGDNKILGLNYTPPSKNNDAPFALKTIISALFGIDAKSEIKFNDFRYHIKYRTQDSLRVSQVRPDLQNFMKNSSFERYPHHEQYYGQQDKIVDSERYSANLFGKLIRVANAVYQCQECADAKSEKESGDLVEINGEPYYVTSCENEYYADAIFQKVTYSKNFNQLSNIVTIPSEPRFYEVSERSLVRREVRLMEFLILTTKENEEALDPVFMNNNKWRNFVKSVIFADGTFALPNFAFTRFKGDKKRQHGGNPLNKLFPSSEVTRLSDNTIQPKESSDHKDVIVPVLHFPLKNAVVFEWDMDDNFKAGDSVDTSISGTGKTIDDAYYSMQPVRYCDVMGRADLFNFRLFNKTNWTEAQSRRLPFAESDDFVPTESDSLFCIPNNLSIGLDKDNREAVSFNLQVNLLQEDASFITYSNLFGKKSSRLKMCLLNIEASLYDDGVSITVSTMIADNVTYSLQNTSKNAIEIKITRPANIDASAIKSIVLYEEDGASKYAYIAKNISKVADEDKFKSWWIYPIFTQ